MYIHMRPFETQNRDAHSAYEEKQRNPEGIIPTTNVVCVPSKAPHIKSTQHRKSLLWKWEKLVTVGYVSHMSERRTGVASRPEWKITAAALVHPLQLYTNFLSLSLFVSLYFSSSLLSH